MTKITKGGRRALKFTAALICSYLITAFIANNIDLRAVIPEYRVIAVFLGMLFYIMESFFAYMEDSDEEDKKLTQLTNTMINTTIAKPMIANEKKRLAEEERNLIKEMRRMERQQSKEL